MQSVIAGRPSSRGTRFEARGLGFGHPVKREARAVDDGSLMGPSEDAESMPPFAARARQPRLDRLGPPAREAWPQVGIAFCECERQAKREPLRVRFKPVPGIGTHRSGRARGLQLASRNVRGAWRAVACSKLSSGGGGDAALVAAVAAALPNIGTSFPALAVLALGWVKLWQKRSYPLRGSPSPFNGFRLGWRRLGRAAGAGTRLAMYRSRPVAASSVSVSS